MSICASEGGMGDLAVLEILTEKDGNLEELFETSSITLEVGGVKYVLQLKVEREYP